MGRNLHFRAIMLLAVVISRLAWAADPTADLTHAYSTQGCGPIDQPVTMIYLTRDPATNGHPRPPYVQFWFAHGFDENGRFEGNWDGAQGNVGATWCPTEKDCNPVKRGSLKLQRSGVDGMLTGEVEFELEGPVRGPLSAEPLPPEHQSCG